MMGNDLVRFSFEAHEVRMVVDEKGEPWWVIADVAACLGIANPRHAATRIPDNEKGVVSNDTLGGEQKLATVNEFGLYRLIFTSKKPEAERFKDWMFREVLPSIRRTGSYTVHPPVQESPLPDADALETMLLAALATRRAQLRLSRDVDSLQAGQTRLERENAALRIELAQTQAKAIEAEAHAERAVRTITAESGWFTLVTWAEEQGVRLRPPEDSTEGKRVKRLCREHGIEPGKWRGPRYAVGTYPESILKLWLEDYKKRHPAELPAVAGTLG